MVSAQLKEMSEDECELEMTPMIDVTFLLLIFFMCTLKFKTLEGKLAAYLPKDVGVNQMQAEPIEKVEIRLDVVKEGTKLRPDGTAYKGEGRYVYDTDRVVRYSVGPRKTTSLDEVAKSLEELHQKDPESPATIDARPGIIYSDVVKVLDLALGADFTNITFVGSYE